MAYGKNGATCWLAGAVRTLQKRVEMLEAKDSFKNVKCSIHANTSVSRHKSDGDFEIQNTSPKVRVPRHKPAGDLEHGGVTSADDDVQDMENIPVMGMSPMHGDGFEQVLSGDDGLAASTVSLATVRSKDFVGANAGLCVPRQKAVRELDFFDVNPRVCSQNSAGELDSENITAYNPCVLCGDCESGEVRPCCTCGTSSRD